MQTPDQLRRVARECALDLAADGVVYAESRFAPELHIARGLALEEVVEAVNEGFREGERAAAQAGTPIRVATLLTAMRHAAMSTEIARLAVRYRDEGVAGFDIAGAEAGYPPSRHLDAFEYLRRENAHFTIHAGEAFGLPSIWEAIQWCGADRLGHGVRIVDDITVDGRPATEDMAGALAAEPSSVYLGLLAAYVRDRRIPLEMCPSSNVQTGAAPSVALHPITLLKRLRFRVTVNTDNRLMSGTTMSREMMLLVEAGGLDPRGPALGDDQRDEVGVRPLRRTARHHRHRRQAGVCRPRRRLTPARGGRGAPPSGDRQGLVPSGSGGTRVARRCSSRHSRSMSRRRRSAMTAARMYSGW